MTVTYTADVSNADTKAFLKTMFRWKGSLWKLVWHELILWCIGYTILSLIYRNALNMDQKILFEHICSFAFAYGDFIPFSFMLAYYVTLVVGRWQTQFTAIGWIDKSIMLVSSYIRGTSERARMLRRGVARQMCLLQVLVFRTICISVRRRFPNIDSLVVAGYITPEEEADLEDTKFWLPIKWSMSYVNTAKDEGMISCDVAVSHIYQELISLRGDLLSLWLADWVPVPLNYTQIVFISVRVYLIIMLVGRQILSPSRYSSRYPADVYVPFLSIIQFIIYTGWLKVAEALLNPFGDDDDDFECNWIIDRNFQIGMEIADLGSECDPPSERTGQEMVDTIPLPLYSTQTATMPQHGAIGSASTLDLPGVCEMLSPEKVDEARRESMTFLRRVSSAFRSLSSASDEPHSNIDFSRRGSLSPSPAPPIGNPFAVRHMSIGSTTSGSSDGEEPMGLINQLRKQRRFTIARNYSDIAEGEEEEERNSSFGTRRQLVSESDAAIDKQSEREEVVVLRKSCSSPHLPFSSPQQEGFHLVEQEEEEEEEDKTE